MNTFGKNIFVMGTLLIGVTACKPAGNSDAYQTGSDLCSAQFVRAYNDLNKVIAKADSTQSLLDARKATEDFKSLYSGVNCKAEVTTASSKSEQYIDADARAKAVLEEIDAALDNTRLGYKTNSTLCSEEFVSEYNNVLARARGIDSSSKDQSLKDVRNAAADFKTKYSSVYCQATSGFTTTYIDSDKRMGEIITLIDDFLIARGAVAEINVVNPSEAIQLNTIELQ